MGSPATYRGASPSRDDEMGQGKERSCTELLPQSVVEITTRGDMKGPVKHSKSCGVKGFTACDYRIAA